MDFSKQYPPISWWIDIHGWIEIGADENSDSLIRLLDEGGTWWEDDEATSLDEAINNAENFLIEDLPNRFGKKFKL